MNQNEPNKPIIFSITVELKETEKEPAKPKIVPYDYYRTERRFWGDRKENIKLLLGLSIIGTAFFSFIALLIMW